MNQPTVSIRLTVFFEDPFWVGVFEKTVGQHYMAAKVVFGAEPKPYHIMEIIQNYHRVRFSQPVTMDKAGQLKRPNPKRVQRQITRNMERHGAGTKAQEALKLQRQADKTEHLQKTRAQKEAASQLKFEMKQQKKLEKRRGH